MGKRNMSLAIAFSMLIPLGFGARSAYGDEEVKTQKTHQDQVVEITNDYLDRHAQQVDGVLAYRNDQVTKQTHDAQTFESQSKDDRQAFEKRMADEQKAFLSYLKTARLDERAKMLKDFDAKQRKNRADFVRDQEAKGKAFRDELNKNIAEMHSLLFNEYRDEEKYAQSWQAPVQLSDLLEKAKQHMTPKPAKKKKVKHAE